MRSLLALLSCSALAAAAQFPVAPAPRAADSLAERLGDLQLLDDVRRRAAGGELGGLLTRFDRGELSLRQLESAAAALDPAIVRPRPAASTWSAVERLPWHRRPAGMLALDDVAPPEIEVARAADGRAFVDLAEWDTERFRFVRAGVELESVEQLRGVELAPGDLVLWIDERSATSSAATEERQVLGGALVHLGRADAAGAPDVRLLNVWASFARVPLPWNAPDRVYATNVVLGLDVVAGLGLGATLPRPIDVLLEAHGDGATVEPAAVRLTTIGTGEASARIFVDRHGSDVVLGTRLGGVLSRHTVPVGARTERIVLSANPATIPGFGLGTTTLTLERLAQDDTVHAPAAPLVATLGVNRGWLDASSMEVAASASRVEGTRMRSAWFGPATVRATSGSLSAHAEVLYEVPWALLAACLVGGALGGWVRSTPREGPLAEQPLTRALVGAVVGLTFVLAALTGLASVEAVPASVAATVAGAFPLALLAGFAGRKVLEGLVRKVGLGAAPGP